MNRRAIITAGPLAAFVALDHPRPANAAAAPAGTPPPESPVMALFRRWAAAEAEERAAYAWGAPADRCEALSATRQALDREIAATPCTGPADWIAKASALSAFGAFEIEEGHHRALWAEARALILFAPH